MAYRVLKEFISPTGTWWAIRKEMSQDYFDSLKEECPVFSFRLIDHSFIEPIEEESEEIEELDWKSEIFDDVEISIAGNALKHKLNEVIRAVNKLKKD